MSDGITIHIPDIPPGWATVLAALITAGLGLIVWLLADVRKHAREAGRSASSAEHELKNHHGTNIRNDLDDLRNEVVSRLDSFSRDIRGLRYEIGQLWGAHRQLRDDLDDTATRNRRRPQ